MRPLVPEFIQQQYKAGTFAGSFEACALFADISGFTNITDALMGHGQHGAEVLANIIKDVFDPLIQGVFQQGGFVTNLAGDAFTAVFPAGEYSFDVFRRAFAAAWRMQAVIESTPQHQTAYGDFVVSVKVGLVSGPVNWSIISSKDHKRAVYYFYGGAIDGAAYAEKLAGAGDIIVDAAVSHNLGSLVAAEEFKDHFRITGLQGDLPEAQPVTYHQADPDIVNRFFPPEATRGDLSAEYRQVVSLFVSIPTVQSEDQLQIFMQNVFDLQNRYGGFLNRLDFGDKGANILLYWGAPTAHENDLTRALNFILDLQSQTVIPLNAGMTYGIAHAGYSGGSLAGEYTCHGRGTTLAARFIQASPRGEIWLDGNIAARADYLFELDNEGAMAFKGFTERQEVYILLERKEEIEGFYHGQLVGRQLEQRSLSGFTAPIWQGRYAGVMLIWGEPGIGKSRLVHDFLGNMEEEYTDSFSIFLCQTDEILRESLNPFGYWLAGYFGQSEQQSVARNKRSFNRQLDRLIASTKNEAMRAELDRTRSFLGALVNLEWPDSLYEQLDAQGRYENSFNGLLTLLLAESLLQPVILLLEDVHWLDEDTKSFLNRLTRRLENENAYPIAILATARREADFQPLGDVIPLEELDLGKLSPANLAAMAFEQLGSPVGSGLQKLLAERSEGNPFFAEQILRYLQEQDLIKHTEDKWELKNQQAAVVPNDVGAVMVARLDKLTHEVKEVVQTASVLGREFEIRLLATILHDDLHLLEKVQRAEQYTIWTALGELRYLFKHALLRDAAYHMQVRSRLQTLHKLAAEALEDLYADELNYHYGELAYHSEKAALNEKARRYLKLAGETAQKAFHNRLAVDYFSRALDQTAENDWESRFLLLQARELLYDPLGEKRAQQKDLTKMDELAERLDDDSKRATVLIRGAWLFWWQADYVEALDAALQAATLADETGDGRISTQAHYAIAWAHLQSGNQEEARRAAEEALTLAKKVGDDHSAGNALNILGMSAIAEGDFYKALGYLDKFLANARKIEDFEREAAALGNLGVAYTLLGQFNIARDYYDQGLEISRKIGSRKWIVSELVNMSWLGSAQGDWEFAVKQGEAGLAMAGENPAGDMEAEALIWLGHAWQGLNKPDKAMEAYDKSLSIRRESGQEHLAMGVLAGMARVALSQNDLEAAADFALEILSYLDGGGSLDGTWEPLRIMLTCYHVLQLIENSRANEVLVSAYETLFDRANKIPDEDARQVFLENVPWHREILAIVETIH